MIITTNSNALQKHKKWFLSLFMVVLAVTVANLSVANPPDNTPQALRNEAFEHMQTAMAGSAASALAQLGVRFAAGSDDLAKAVRLRQDLIEAWRKADKQLVQVLAAQNSVINVDNLRNKVEELQKQIETSDLEMAQNFPAYAALASPKPVSISQTQNVLDTDEALVSILLGVKEAFIFGITKDAIKVVRVPVKLADLKPKVKALRRGLNPDSLALMRSGLRNFGESTVEGTGNDIGRVQFDRQIAYELYRDFIEPVDSLIASKKRVFFVLEGSLDLLPLSLLVTAPPQGDNVNPAALRDTPWLIKRQSLVVLPSVASLITLRSAKALARAPEPFRGYGAPLLADDASRFDVATRSTNTPASVYKGGVVDVEAVRSLKSLPKTKGELLQLAAVLGAPETSVRIGKAATVKAVKSDDLSRYRVLAFATHGLLAGELAGLAEPALVFTPPSAASDEDNGLLTASDAAKLQLAAEWVILSACNTASGDGTPGADGLSGLARAFFYAGAKTLLVSHWPVRDDAAARITTQTFKAMANDDKLGKADALRLAVLALMQDESDPTLAHPAIWAPFIVVGEGR